MYTGYNNDVIANVNEEIHIGYESFKYVQKNG